MGLQQKGIINRGKLSEAISTYEVTIAQNIQNPQKENGVFIVADMTNNFQYSLNSTWENLFTNLVPGSDTIAKLGNTSFKTGIFSRKYFKDGGSLSLNIELKIFDDGTAETNPVVKAAKGLSSLSVADAFSKEALAEGVNRGEKAIGEVKSFVGNVLGGNGQKSVGNVSNVINTLTDTGRTVSVRIGNIFNCQKMIITNLSVAYSRQTTVRGPLFGEFTITVESFESIVKTGTTFGINNILGEGSQGRVSIDGQNADGGIAANTNALGGFGGGGIGFG